MWEQPKTIKLYLHPPLANRQVTLWPDFKIVNKVVVPLEGHQPDDYGVRFLFGAPLQEPDWLQSRWHVRDDGAPMPWLETTWDDLVISLEAFCDSAVQTTTFARLTLRNDSPVERVVRVGVMLRTGLDRLLIGMDGDYYASYRPRLGHWDFIASTWQLHANLATDGVHQVRLGLPNQAQAGWQVTEEGNREAKNVALVNVPVAGCSETILYFTLGSEVPEANEVTFNSAKRAAEAFWASQFAKIKRRPALPGALVPMFNHLVSQSLQMLVTTSSGEIWPRQGGRYDGIWPVEAMEWLYALDHLGLHEWTARGLEFFRRHQVTEGDEAGRFVGVNSPRWQNETGGVLYALAGHLVFQQDQQLLNQWRGPILAAVDYIERLRVQTRHDPDALGYGLLPPGLGHDWQWKGQYWCFSDTIMYLGLNAAAHAFSALGDHEAPRLEALAADYRACLQRTLQMVTARQENRADVYIPNVLGIPENYPPFGPYTGDGPSNLIRAGILDPKSDLFSRMELFWRRQGWMQNGLTEPMGECLMTQGYFADPWAGYTWYTNFADLHWFRGWLARGERDKAAQTLGAQMRYGMSAEYYMLERYAANDPTFCPWQPNASANGRTIEMLFDFYGEA
ncbi:MAG: hypothetical protein ACYC6L_10920 [Anaerolineae bacterium]